MATTVKSVQGDYQIIANGGAGTITLVGNVQTTTTPTTISPFLTVAANNTGLITEMGLLAQKGPNSFAGLRFTSTSNVWQVSDNVAGDGSPISAYANIQTAASTYGDANVAAYLPTYTGNLGTPNTTPITAVFANAYFYGNGDPFVGGGSGSYSNANVQDYLPTYAGNIGGGIGLNVTGVLLAATAPNGTSNNQVATTAFVANAIGGGGGSTYGDANVAAFLPTYTGGMFSMTGPVSTTNAISSGANINATNWLNSGLGVRTLGDIILNGNIQFNSSNPNLSLQQGNISAGNMFLSRGLQLNGPIISGNSDTAFTTPGEIDANVFSGNVGVFNGNVSASFYTGNGRLLTGILSNYGNSNVANYLPTYTGNMVSMTGNVVTTANIQANFFVGNGRALTGVISSYNDSNVAAYLPSYSGNIGNNVGLNVTGILTANTPANGTNNTQVATTQFVIAALSGGAIGYGNSNVASFLPTYTGNLASLQGNVVTTANVQANFFIGNGRALTGIISSYSNANVANYLPTYTGNLPLLGGNVTTNANVQASFFIGNGRALTGIISNYSNANVANYLPTYTGNLSSLTGPVTTVANVTANSFIGGRVSVSNTVTANGNITSSGNIQGAFILGDGSQLTNLPIPGVYGNSNVALYLPTYSGSIGGNIGLQVTGVLTANTPANGTSNTQVATTQFVLNEIANLAVDYGNANVANFLPTYTGGMFSMTGQVFTTADINADGNISSNSYVNAQQGLVTLGGINLAGPMQFTNTNSTLSLQNGNLSCGNILANADLTISGQILSLNTGVAVSTPGNISVNSLLANAIENKAGLSGNIGTSAFPWNTVFAKATSAQYADLAEMYAADKDYEPGTVVEFGGAAELTQTTTVASTRVAGIVSTQPAFIMNERQEGSHTVALALAGRVPCRVIGPIQKGDLIVSSSVPGVACSLPEALYKPGSIIGKALDNYNNTEVGVIEVVVGVR